MTLGPVCRLPASSRQQSAGDADNAAFSPSGRGPPVALSSETTRDGRRPEWAQATLLKNPIVAGCRPRTFRLVGDNGSRLPKSKEIQSVATRNYCGKFATFIGRGSRPSPLWGRPPAVLLRFQGGEKFMVLGTGRCTRSSVRVIVQATAYSVLVLAALVLFGTAGVLSPAMAQVKAPAKAKLKPPVKTAPQADPTRQRRQSTQCQMAAGERRVRRLQAGGTRGGAGFIRHLRGRKRLG